MAHTSEPAEPMAHRFEPSEPKGSTENINVKLRKSFSWDRAFFTSDGVLDAEELSSMIEGGGKDVKNQLQGIDEELSRSMDSISTLENDNLALERLEAKLFEDIKASTQKSSRTSTPTNSSIKVLSSPCSSTPVKTHPPRPSPPHGGATSSSQNNIKSLATLEKRTTGSKSGQTMAGSTSKPPSGTTTNRKLPPLNSVSTSRVKNVKSSGSNSRKRVDTKTSKPTTDSTPETLSRIGRKNKPPPVNSCPLVFLNSSSSTSIVNQRPISKGTRGPSVHKRFLDQNAPAKAALKNHPTGWNSDRNGKQPPTQTGLLSRPLSTQPTAHRGNSGTPKRPTQNQSHVPKTGTRNTISNDTKTRKLPPQKNTASHTNLNPNSQKTSTPKRSQERSQQRSKTKSTILVTSPEVLDIKGKINALGMEISMQKKDSFKETPGLNESCSNNANKQSSKDRHQGKWSTSKKGKYIVVHSRTPFSIQNEKNR